ncbi:MAG: prenyltransferase/squalene oxidase repeat-containing protein [Candidatus Paceibacterota bacterium]
MGTLSLGNMKHTNIKKFLFIVIIILSAFSFSFVFAEEVLPEPEPPVEPTPIIETTTIHLTIKTPTQTFYDKEIDVEACNSDNGASETKLFTPYCAILQSEIQNDWNWEWAPGAFLNSLADITGFTTQDKTGTDVYHYWSWSVNSTEGSTGLNQYELKTNDLILLDFIDPAEPEPEPEPEITPEPVSHSSGSGGGRKIEKKFFDSKKALDFISLQQKENGSFGEDLYTDWTALALASSLDYQDQKIKLVKYFSENKISGSLLTDYERHSMALMALNLNPYNLNGENYIEKIIKSFDGKQFGDINQDNDDIFALIVLQNAGFELNEKIITDTIDFIISKQKENGSWDDSVDLTGAGMEALAKFSDRALDSIQNSLEKAKKYLKQNQKENGSWENVSSTTWAMEGILATGEEIENSTLEYLGENQDADGGIKNDNLQNRIWETAYVITATSKKTWNEIMQKFPKPLENKIIPAHNAFSIADTGGENSHQVVFAKKIKKFQKPVETIVKQEIKPDPILNTPEINQKPVIKKQNWFVRFFKKIFGF